MHIRSKVVSKIIVGMFAVLGGTIANAMLIDETTDAGQTLADALVLPGDATGVNGQINGDVDLFGFSLAADADVTLSAVSDDFDMNLLVFNGLGQGLAGNDDLNRNGGCAVGDIIFDSCLELSLLAGDYFFAVGVNNVAALDGSGNVIMTNDSGILGAPTATTLDAFTNGQGGGAYRVSIGIPTGPAPVPAPASLLLVGAALIGMRFFRKRA